MQSAKKSGVLGHFGFSCPLKYAVFACFYCFLGRLFSIFLEEVCFVHKNNGKIHLILFSTYVIIKMVIILRKSLRAKGENL